jgi:hypothetical protein
MTQTGLVSGGSFGFFGSTILAQDCVAAPGKCTAEPSCTPEPAGNCEPALPGKIIPGFAVIGPFRGEGWSEPIAAQLSTKVWPPRMGVVFVLLLVASRVTLNEADAPGASGDGSWQLTELLEFAQFQPFVWTPTTVPNNGTSFAATLLAGALPSLVTVIVNSHR